MLEQILLICFRCIRQDEISSDGNDLFPPLFSEREI